MCFINNEIAMINSFEFSEYWEHPNYKITVPSFNWNVVFDQLLENNYNQMDKKDEVYEVVTSVPGLTKEEVKVSIKDTKDNFIIKVETPKTNYTKENTRLYSVPLYNIKKKSFKYTVENGLLTITVDRSKENEFKEID